MRYTLGKRKIELEKQHVPYLSASDIVNGGGPTYYIEEPEMQSAIDQTLKDISDSKF